MKSSLVKSVGMEWYEYVLWAEFSWTNPYISPSMITPREDVIKPNTTRSSIVTRTSREKISRYRTEVWLHVWTMSLLYVKWSEMTRDNLSTSRLQDAICPTSLYATIREVVQHCHQDNLRLRLRYLWGILFVWISIVCACYHCYTCLLLSVSEEENWVS